MQGRDTNFLKHRSGLGCNYSQIRAFCEVVDSITYIRIFRLIYHRLVGRSFFVVAVVVGALVTVSVGLVVVGALVTVSVGLVVVGASETVKKNRKGKC